MSDQVLIALIAVVGTTAATFLTTLGGVITIYLQLRKDRKDAADEAAKLHKGVETIRVATNHIKDELVETTRIAAHEAGRKAERDEQEQQTGTDANPQGE